MGRKLTQQEFLDISKEVHGDKYDYSKSAYTGSNSKLIITCLIHGDWQVAARNHLRGNGCQRCANQAKANLVSEKCKKEFVVNANKIHNNFYSYEKFIYEKSSIKSTITCPLHGDFLQSGTAHLSGSGCRECGIISYSTPKREKAAQTFIERAKKVHGNVYDYSETVYIKSRIKVLIKCRKHGQYEQYPVGHLSGMGCPLCGHERTTQAHIENPMGWRVSCWRKCAENSKKFDSFKVYILCLFNDNEKFYKIGRTFNKTETRIKIIPYKVEILHEIKHKDAEVIFNLEHHLKREYKSFKYTPKLDFGGKCECFSLDLPISDIIANYPTNYTPKIDDAPIPTP
jgi:hypothetical protein